MYTNKEIGGKVRRVREMKWMSQEDLSFLLGVDRPAISSIETGKRKLDINELIKILGISNMGLDEFLALEPSVKKSIGHKERKNQFEERNKDIFRRYLLGETMSEIGESYGITAQRVQQILQKLS